MMCFFLNLSLLYKLMNTTTARKTLTVCNKQTTPPSAVVVTQTPTAAATTVAPTVAVTAAPDTAAPVTAAPVTAAPVTAAPVTAAPSVTSSPTAAAATQQPVDTTDRQLYAISMSTVLSNLTVAEFNGTAFGLAVTDTVAAKYTTDGITVSIPASGVTATTTTAARRLQRRLQAATPSVAVAYDVQHITGAQNAANIQAWLASAEGNALLAERYRLRSASAVAGTTTTAVKDPQPETGGNRSSSGSSTPIGLIVGVVLGVLALLVLAVMWCKRKQLASCCMRTKQRDPSEQPLDSESNGGLVRGASAYSSSSVRTVPTPLKRRLSSSSQTLEQQDDIEQSMQAGSSSSMSMASVGDSGSRDVVNSNVIRGMDRGAELQRDAHHDSSHSVAAVAVAQQPLQQQQQQQQLVSVDRQQTAATRSSSTSSTTTTSAVAIAPVVITGAIVQAPQGISAAHSTTSVTTADSTSSSSTNAVAVDSDSALPRKTSMTDRAAEVAKNVSSSLTSVLKKGAEQHGAAVVTGTH
jgi:hypothetical protein